MSRRRLLALCGMLLLGGCLYHAREETDRALCDLSSHPYDLLPSLATEPAATTPPAGKPPSRDPSTPGEKSSAIPPSNPMVDIQTTAWMQGKPTRQASSPAKNQYDLHIPSEIPGSEAKTIQLPGDAAAKQREIQRLYPELPALPSEPVAEQGPSGRPYTLAELQQLAAGNSPQLRQAASDVQAAKGNLIRAKAYPNPTVGYEVDPSNDGSAPGVQGLFVDQTVKFAGKLKLQTAAAEMDLRNAVLALNRARSDLATQVRTAYFGVLVAKETVRVNRALARFTDEIYRIQTGMLGGGFAAPYEPATLRAQAYTARLAYKQAIQNYTYAWKQLVAALGLRQLPLTEVAGRVDAALPYYDYDAVLSQVLRTHTDVLTARNGIDKAKYNLKFAQIAPYPDVDFRVAILKEYVLPPKQTVPTLQVGVPFPVWDQNKGAIIAAEAALVLRQRGTPQGRDKPDDHPGERLQQLQKQPGRAGILPQIHPAGSGSRLSRCVRAPSDRSQLGLRRPGHGAADTCCKRCILPDYPGAALDIRCQRRGPAADGRPVPTRSAARIAAAARPRSHDGLALLSRVSHNRCATDRGGRHRMPGASCKLSSAAASAKWRGVAGLGDPTLTR